MHQTALMHFVDIFFGLNAWASFEAYKYNIFRVVL